MRGNSCLFKGESDHDGIGISMRLVISLLIFICLVREDTIKEWLYRILLWIKVSCKT